MNRSLLILCICLWFPSIARLQPDIVINEVLYHQEANSDEPIRDHEWVELYNRGLDTINLSGWTVSDRDAQPLAQLPTIKLPPRTYLLIHFSTGINDFDFTDNYGNFYTQENPVTTEHFSERMDEAALYKEAPSADNIIDFLAWNINVDGFEGGQAHDLAVAAGQWTEGDFFLTDESSSASILRIKSVEPGESIGRDKDSNDFDSPRDWDVTGGIHAFDITPGEQNLDLLRIIIPPAKKPNPKRWTVLVYLDGDNPYEEFAFRSFNQMERAGSNKDVNVVVMVDWAKDKSDVQVSTDNEITFRPTEGTWRGYLLPEEDVNPKRVKLIPVIPAGGGPPENPFLGERNMGDPAELTQFVNWGIRNFPADRYALIIWGEGFGWKANTFDDLPVDELHIGELQTAMAGFTRPMNLIGFDAELMGMMEVAYQIRNHTNVFVASEGMTHVKAWPYFTILSDLKARPFWNEISLGKNIVRRFGNFYKRTVVFKNHTLSAVATNASFKALALNVSNFGLELAKGIEDYNKHYDPSDNVQEMIAIELFSTESFMDPNYIDLFDFASRINLNGGIPNQYKKQARLIVDRMNKGGAVILAETHGPGHPNAHGLSIYFPKYQTKDFKFMGIVDDPYDDPTNSFIANDGTPQAKYAADPDDCVPLPPNGPGNHPLIPTPNFLFPKETKWDELLHRYYEPVADAGKDLIVFENQIFELNGSGSSDADGKIDLYIWDFDNRISTDILDWDVDCVNEKNDDKDALGELVFHSYPTAGSYWITLTVWDDHNKQAGHEFHTETDQDSLLVIVLPDIPDFNFVQRDVVSPACHSKLSENLCFIGTLGEWMTESLALSDDLGLCQGFHQASNISVAVDEPFKIVDIRVFPNPTFDVLHIRSGIESPLKAELLDVNGRVLLHHQLPPLTEKESISLQGLPAAIYFLRIFDDNHQLISSFKIQKTAL